MPFDFFYRKQKDKQVREFINHFQNEFSTEQKEAIMCSLFFIANSDMDFAKPEQKFFERMANVIGYKLQKNVLDKFMGLCEREKLFVILRDLNEKQKDWFIMAAVGMMKSDGIVTESELDFLMSFFNDMDIDEARVQEVLKRVESIKKIFR